MNTVNRTRTSVKQLSSPSAEFAVKLDPSSPRKRRQYPSLPNYRPSAPASSVARLGRLHYALPEMPYCPGYCRHKSLFQQDGGEQAAVMSLSSAGGSRRVGGRGWDIDGTGTLSGSTVKRVTIHSLFSRRCVQVNIFPSLFLEFAEDSAGKSFRTRWHLQC
jgi:hypothetical protein